MHIAQTLDFPNAMCIIYNTFAEATIWSLSISLVIFSHHTWHFKNNRIFRVLFRIFLPPKYHENVLNAANVIEEI